MKVKLGGLRKRGKCPGTRAGLQCWGLHNLKQHQTATTIHSDLCLGSRVGPWLHTHFCLLPAATNGWHVDPATFSLFLWLTQPLWSAQILSSSRASKCTLVHISKGLRGSGKGPVSQEEEWEGVERRDPRRRMGKRGGEGWDRIRENNRGNGAGSGEMPTAEHWPSRGRCWTEWSPGLSWQPKQQNPWALHPGELTSVSKYGVKENYSLTSL